MRVTAQDPHLRSLLEASVRIVAETEQLVSPLIDEQLLQPPADGGWSIAQCFHHLIVSNGEYLPRIQVAISEGRARKRVATLPYQPSWVGRWFIKAVSPATTSRMKAPAVFRPSDQPSPSAPRDFLAQQRTLDELMLQSDGLDLIGLKITSPVTRLLRFRLGEAFEVIIRHEERHLEQAKRVATSLSGNDRVGAAG
ncbi:MAG: DinB family protein [Anaerolineae bacterium]|nr:DinB family protein [Gemmatimonadaceae bacterium]